MRISKAEHIKKVFLNWKIFIAIAMCIGLSGCSQKPNDVTVRNDSNSIIEEAKIIICEQTFVAKNLKHGEKRKFNFAIKGDSHYQINVKFTDGRSLKKEDGYVTKGFIFHDMIFINKNSVNIKQENTMHLY